MRVLHEVKNLKGDFHKRRQESEESKVPFSLVLGAKRRGHRVRQYEKIRRAAMPINDEINI